MKQSGNAQTWHNCICAFLCRTYQFQPTFASFVAISAALCRCFKAISLQCRNLAQQGLKKVAKTSVYVINGDAPNKGETILNTTVVWA